MLTKTKKEVCELNIVKHVIFFASDITFNNWWKSLDDTDEVEVRYPHEQHGLCGKKSNRAKTEVMESFLTFVDNNSTPNGHRADSHCPTSYFLPKFHRIEPPKSTEKNFDEKASSSLVSEFNRAQESEGKPGAGSYAIRQWLKTKRPKVAIHPHKLDYCDSCKRLEMELSRNRQIIKRLRQSGSASAEDIQSKEQIIVDLKEELKDHKYSATKSQEVYRETTSQCKRNWKSIQDLSAKTSLTNEEEQELARKRTTFTLVLDADYQQSKLIPYWGSTAQPGSTYYLQKVSHDLLGIIDHRDDYKHISLFDERIGPKNTDHTLSILQKYIEEVTHLHPWISRVLIFFDNASNTNKNRYLFGWGMEIVDQGKLDYFRFSFMIAGHTKFAPDRLFAQVSNSYNRQDVFTVAELKDVCNPHAQTVIEDGSSVFNWRDLLILKYSDLPGTRKLHDFLIARSYQGSLVMKVREKYYDGSFHNSPLRVIDPSAAGTPTSNYKDTRFKELSTEKLEHMITMYNNFIPPERRPDYLPPFEPPALVRRSTSRQLPNPGSSSEPPKKSRKKSSCSTPGCDGSGHKNPIHWSKGHTTRAGCPLLQ